MNNYNKLRYYYEVGENTEYLGYIILLSKTLIDIPFFSYSSADNMPIFINFTL